MASLQVKELIGAGMHFGHRSSRWNPKMAPYIFGKRNLIHIIDLKETIRGMILAARFVARVAARGQYVLFVGTKRQAREAIKREAMRVGCPYVAERWLGGCLTNFRTVRSRLSRLLELERLEETGEINAYSKKMVASLRREKHKMLRNLDGLRLLDRLPGAVVVVDPRHEAIAVREASKLNIRAVALMDTDSDPDLVSIPVPGNDDSIRSIEIFLARMADAVEEGKQRWLAMPPEQRAQQRGPAREPGGRPRDERGRRPRRGRGSGPSGRGGRGRSRGGGRPAEPTRPRPETSAGTASETAPASAPPTTADTAKPADGAKAPQTPESPAPATEPAAPAAERTKEE